MKKPANRLWVLVIAGFLLPGSLLRAEAQTYNLEQVLAKMNEVGQTFRSLEASIDRTRVTVLVNDEVLEQGKVYFSRKAAGSRIRFDFTKPMEYSALIDMGKASVYYPRIKQVREHVLGGDQDKAEFLLIGFGQSNESIRKTYDASLAGEETIDGQKTSIVDLKPKSAQVSAMFTTIRLWIDQKRWIPVQTRVTEANRDFQIVKFSNIRMNAGIADSIFKLKLPRDVQVLRM